jgi:hypothetical protein
MLGFFELGCFPRELPIAPRPIEKEPKSLFKFRIQILLLLN